MPVEAWLLIAGAAVGALLVGLWLGRRSAASRGSGAAPVDPTAAPPPPTPGASSTDLSEQAQPADQLGIGLVRVDARGTVESANRSAQDMLGWRPRGLVGKSLLEAFLDHGVEELAAQARRDGHATGEYVLTGEPQRILSVNAWRAEGGGEWIALVDVSELRRLRRIRTEFVDNLSHELRTPLSTVRLLTESLSIEAERNDLPPRVRESIAKIDVETGHLVQMVNELLDLAKIEHGDTSLRHDEVDMALVVEEAIGRLNVYAERQSVTLRRQLDGTSDDTTVVGDEDRLAQLLANLIHNAIKFSPQGGEVVVHVRGDAENVLVEVEDHGPGIPRADRNRIFERFYKVDRARSRASGGTGLGLSIARNIVGRHHGHIWVQSEEGEGSSFFVSLPRAARAG